MWFCLFVVQFSKIKHRNLDEKPHLVLVQGFIYFILTGMRKWVKKASCRLFFVVFNLMTPMPVKKKMRVMSQEATLSKLDSRLACTVWPLPISVPYCIFPHRKKQKEKPGGGWAILKSSKNHCLQLADELTWQRITPVPCALMNYVDGIGKSAPLQPHWFCGHIAAVIFAGATLLCKCLFTSVWLNAF